MNLYLISQNDNNGYDTYDSAVVCASSENSARFIHPDGTVMNKESFNQDSKVDWASSPEKVKVKLIGKADNCLKKGIVCSSFNDG